MTISVDILAKTTGLTERPTCAHRVRARWQPLDCVGKLRELPHLCYNLNICCYLRSAVVAELVAGPAHRGESIPTDLAGRRTGHPGPPRPGFPYPLPGYLSWLGAGTNSTLHCSTPNLLADSGPGQPRVTRAKLPGFAARRPSWGLTTRGRPRAEVVPTRHGGTCRRRTLGRTQCQTPRLGW